MALNISLPSSAIAELESYRWYGPSGASLKDVRTSISFDESTWTDVSDWVMQIAISGAVVNQSGEPGANTAVVELDNLDKRFSDLWSTGPYAGNLLPGKSAKIELSVACSLVTIFAGKIDAGGFAEMRVGHEGTVQVRIADGADRLEKKKFDKDYYYAGKKLVGTDETDSLLHILLMTHGGLSAGNIITNGEVSIIVPYTSFKEGESVQYRVRELARGCLPSYCGFRHDGNFIMESRLVTGWSVPVSEYTLTASSFDTEVNKTLLPLLGNHVKVRGDKVDFIDEPIVLWELRAIKPKGKNRVFPDYCWETVASGDFFLSDPGASPPEEFWAQYEVPFGEIIHVESTAISQTVYEGAAYDMNTTGTTLEAEETKGQLVLQNSQPQSVTVMNLQITGKAAIRRSIGKRSESDISHLKLDHGVSDDDLGWGLVAVDSNASSIAAYGQTDLVISSEYIVDNSQLISILDWNLKYGKDPKHHFSLGNLPFLAFVQPGAPLNLGLSDLGYSALVEVAEFSHQITPMGAKTILSLVETPGDWTVSSAASVQQIIAAPSGGTGEGEIGAGGLGGNLVYTIGSYESALPVDRQCSGAADEEEINEAIQAGNKTIYLVGGKFVISSPISVVSGVTLDIDTGSWIENYSDDYAIEAFGTASTHLSSINIVGAGKITQHPSIANSTALIHFEYADDWLMDAIKIEDADNNGIEVYLCRNGKFSNTFVRDCANAGMLVTGSQFIIASSVSARGCSIGVSVSQDVPGEVNAIVNGDCEIFDAVDGWGPYFDCSTVVGIQLGTNVSVCTSVSVVHSGSAAVKVSKEANSAAMSYWQVGYDGTVGVASAMHGHIQGKTYYLKHWVCRPGTDIVPINKGYTDVEYYDLPGPALHTLTQFPWPTAASSTWVLVEGVYTVPSNIVGFRIVEVLSTSVPSGTVAYFDDYECFIKSDLNSGLRMMNGNVLSCVNGITVAGSRNRVQGCHVEGCSNKGIWIKSGLANAVMDNEAFDNGDDAGASNANTDNFDDDGMSTLIGDNTWN